MQTILQKHDAAEKTFFVFMLFILSGSLFPFNMDHYSAGGREAIEAPGSYLFRYVVGGFYSITGLLLLYRWKQAVRAARACPWIVLLLFLACLSAAWSTEPELTIRRAIALLGTNMLGFYLVTRFSLHETLSLLAVSFGFALIFSLILVVYFPEYGINPAPHQGAWRGIFSQKQAAGIYFSLAFLVFLGTALFSINVKYFLSLLGVVCSAFFVYKTDSKTASILLLLIAASFAFLTCFVRKERRTPRMWFLVVFVIANVMVWTGYSTVNRNQFDKEQTAETEANSSFSGVFNSLGRDQTLTGRTVIWAEVLSEAVQRPLAGYGYVGFVWPSDIGVPYAQIREKIDRKLNFYVNQSHNGYIHLFLALGGSGVLLLLLAVGAAAKNCIVCIVANGAEYKTVWAGMFLSWFLAANITSTLILDQNLIYWPLFILAAVHLRWERARPGTIPITERKS